MLVGYKWAHGLTNELDTNLQLNINNILPSGYRVTSLLLMRSLFKLLPGFMLTNHAATNMTLNPIPIKKKKKPFIFK